MCIENESISKRTCTFCAFCRRVYKRMGHWRTPLIFVGQAGKVAHNPLLRRNSDSEFVE